MVLSCIILECPEVVADDVRCESSTALITLLFQPSEADPIAVAEDFEDNLGDAIKEGELQRSLTLLHPDSPVFIIDDNVDPPPPGPTDERGIGDGGVAGVVVAALAVAVIVLLVSRRRGEPKESYDDLESVPEDEELKLDDADTEGATDPKFDKQAPEFEKGQDAMMDLDEQQALSHDSSSDAGNSGWSSSAGVSSLNTGSAGDLDPEHPTTGVTSALAALTSQPQVLQTKEESTVPNIPAVSRADLDVAIEAGDWAAVGATAALLAAASDSQSYSSQSKSRDVSRSGSSVSSMDAARAAELDHLVDAGDWEGVVLAAAKFEAAESFSESGSRSTSRDESSQSQSSGGEQSRTVTGSMASSSKRTRAELRSVVESLVQKVVPEEIDNVDEMMMQFRGREEELIETLRTMEEKAVAQRAREGAQKAAKLEAKQSVESQRGSIFPASSSKSLGTGQVASPANTKSLGTGKVEGPKAKSKSLGTGTMETKKKPSEREKKQSALEKAIEAGDWEAVGEAAALLSDQSSMTSADTDEIDRIAEGISSQGSYSRVDDLDDLIDKGDWTGVAKAASGYKSDDEKKTKKEEEESRRQRRLKKLQEEQEALAQAEVWMAIAEQSKPESTETDQGASEAADWAIQRSLNAMVKADKKGDSEETSTPQLKEENQEEV